MARSSWQNAPNARCCCCGARLHYLLRRQSHPRKKKPLLKRPGFAEIHKPAMNSDHSGFPSPPEVCTSDRFLFNCNNAYGATKDLVNSRQRSNFSSALTFHHLLPGYLRAFPKNIKFHFHKKDAFLILLGTRVYALVQILLHSEFFTHAFLA